MIELVGLFKVLTKKNEKILIIEILYVLLIFGFEPSFLIKSSPINFALHFQSKLNHKPSS